MSDVLSLSELTSRKQAKRVDLPSGGGVYVRKITALELQRLREIGTEEGNWMGEQLAVMLGDKHGARLVAPEDRPAIEKLGEVNAEDFEAIVSAGSEFNGQAAGSGN